MVALRPASIEASRGAAAAAHFSPAPLLLWVPAALAAALARGGAAPARRQRDPHALTHAQSCVRCIVPWLLMRARMCYPALPADGVGVGARLRAHGRTRLNN
jgi:hypothetical protein